MHTLAVAQLPGVSSDLSTNLTPNPQSNLPLVVTDGGTASDRIRVQYGTPLVAICKHYSDKQVNSMTPSNLKVPLGSWWVTSSC